MAQYTDDEFLPARRGTAVAIVLALSLPIFLCLIVVLPGYLASVTGWSTRWWYTHLMALLLGYGVSFINSDWANSRPQFHRNLTIVLILVVALGVISVGSRLWMHETIDPWRVTAELLFFPMAVYLTIRLGRTQRLSADEHERRWREAHGIPPQEER